VYLHQELTHQIIAAAIEVHKNLGPGLLEAVYRLCLGMEFESRGLQYQQEVAIPLGYKGRKIDHCFRLDFLVENKVIVELKSIEHVLPVHGSQLLTYLRLAEKQVGLLINFNVATLKTGIHRRILDSQNSHHAYDPKVSIFPNAEISHEAQKHRGGV
jgi:GxxExxY protein